VHPLFLLNSPTVSFLSRWFPDENFMLGTATLYLALRLQCGKIDVNNSFNEEDIMTSKLHLLPEGILERLDQLPEQVASLDGLIAFWLFGSFARGEATPVSDVDLAYLPDEDLQGDVLEPFETKLTLTWKFIFPPVIFRPLWSGDCRLL